MPSQKIVPINYTSREFETIKRDLIEHAKRYYPNTFKDFSDASFGSLMLDTVAYTGDILSFYLDYQANESYLDSAIEYQNVIKLGRQLGYKISPTGTSTGIISIYISVPAATSGFGPDTNYIPILQRGTTLTSDDGGSFILLSPVDFSDSNNEIVVSKVNDSTGLPIEYAIKSFGQIISGRLSRDRILVGNYEKFFRFVIPGNDIAEVISIVDSEGHSYFEVEHLAQNVIWKALKNRGDDRESVKEILKPIVVPRRFIVERDGTNTIIQFGYGSEENLRTNLIPDPSSVALQLHGRDYISDVSFDPSKLLKTDKFGVSPANTTLTVIYRVNSSQNANASPGTVNTVTNASFDFPATLDGTVLNQSKVSLVVNSLEVTNEDAIIGEVKYPGSYELKTRILGNFATQKRAVSQQDYINMIYSMPAEFGAVKRAAVLQDKNSFKRNLNLYVVSEDKNGNLISSNSSIKSNLKSWLMQYKMINDTIDILPAKIVNIGIEFIALAEDEVNKFSTLSVATDLLTDELASIKMDIGESFRLSKVYSTLRLIPGIMDVLDVVVTHKQGGIYSTTSFDVGENLSSDGRTLIAPQNVIFEIKNPNTDIRGTIR